MNMAEYFTELKNILNKINRQTWTEIKMLEGNNYDTRAAGPEELKTLDKAKEALNAVTEILQKI